MTTVIVTRPKHHIQQAEIDYRKAGFSTIGMPCVEITTNESMDSKLLLMAQKAEILIILNSNAIIHALKIKPGFEVSANTQVIGIGPAVKNTWESFFDHPMEMPLNAHSEAIVNWLKKIQKQKKVNTVSILTAPNGLNVIKVFLMRQHISYCQMNTYMRHQLVLDYSQLAHTIASGKDIILTMTSGESIESFLTQAPDHLKEKILELPIICGSYRLDELARQLGFNSIFTANNPSNSEMIKCALKIKSDQNQ